MTWHCNSCDGDFDHPIYDHYTGEGPLCPNCDRGNAI